MEEEEVEITEREEYEEYLNIQEISKEYKNRAPLDAHIQAYWQAMFFFGEDSPLVTNDKLCLFNFTCYINDKLVYDLHDLIKPHFNVTIQDCSSFLYDIIPDVSEL